MQYEDILYKESFPIDLQEPYPDEHAARVRDPGDFQKDSFRSKELPKSDVRMIIGKLKGETTTTVQSYRFPKDKFTVAQAKKWLKDNDVKYVEFEPAKETKESLDFKIDNITDRIIELKEKGRVLSVSNEKKLRNAVEMLQTVLSQLSESKRFNERWKNDLSEILKNSLTEKHNEAQYIYIDDFDENWVIYEFSQKDSPSKSYKVNYTIDENDNVTFGEPVEVIRKVIYVPVELNQKESSDIEINEKPIKLIEAEFSKEGIIPIKIIQPGWGSSGYYPEEVLERDAEKYKKNTKIFWDHQTQKEERERPEGSLTNLAGKLVSDGVYKKEGPHGKGIYANAKIFSKFQKPIEEMANDIGLSHRAFGKAKKGEAEGRKGNIIEGIDAVKSVDFVTIPGAGGRVTEMFESYRDNLKFSKMEEKELKELQDSKKELEEQNKRLEEQNKRLNEKLLLREAKDFVQNELCEVKLPEITKKRLIENLSQNPVIDDKGEFDQDKMKESIKKAVKEETEYISSIAESGKIKGMGNTNSTENESKLKESLTESFKTIFDGDENKAKMAVEGR